MNNVLKLRQRLSMSQEEFADHCGVARGSICRYEAGENISRPNAEKIAKACNVPVSFVFGYQPDEDYDYAAHCIATRTEKKPEPAGLTEADIAAIARRVQYYSSHTPAENDLIEEFRLLSPDKQHQVRMFIARLLDK